MTIMDEKGLKKQILGQWPSIGGHLIKPNA